MIATSARISAAATVLAAVAVLAAGCPTHSTGSGTVPPSPVPVTAESKTSAPAAPATSAPAAPATSAPAVVKPWNIRTENACALLTEQDATLAVGVDPGPGKTDTEFGPGQCDYSVGTTSNGILIQVVTHSEGKTLFDQLNQAGLADGSSVAVPGLGDAAISISAPDAGFVTLQFVKGTTFVTIILNRDLAGLPLQQAALTAAQTVAARL